ncbi:helix-turn-helix domain-containing protein [Phyllobacterium chamaecytisi]|uniref:helix-turn-helix domain-containing protein n=1 Tax=Phyllobacterium chamaecytisi TaxID=2876082 RepID=UPI001CCDA39B|nr:helix-turn-helix domain-containing protein [Phyllobacterium sp. KW56]
MHGSLGGMVTLTRKSAAASIDKDLGAKLRVVRLAAGLSQSELGEFMGFSHSQVQKYEMGKNRMAVSTLVQFCKVLKQDPMAFLGDHFHRR